MATYKILNTYDLWSVYIIVRTYAAIIWLKVLHKVNYFIKLLSRITLFEVIAGVSFSLSLSLADRQSRVSITVFCLPCIEILNEIHKFIDTSRLITLATRDRGKLITPAAKRANQPTSGHEATRKCTIISRLSNTNYLLYDATHRGLHDRQIIIIMFVSVSRSTFMKLVSF